MIIEVFCSGPLDTNAYLIACPATKKAAIIDAPPDSSGPIAQRAQELSLSVEKILLTHSHWDHIAEVAALKEIFNVPVSIHKDDAENLQSPGADQLPIFVMWQAVKCDSYLVDGQEIALGNLQIKVIHTPGHSPGGVSFYLPKEKVLFSGDTLFRGAIGKLTLPTGRPALMWESLKKLAALPPDTKVYPGHGGPTTIANERWITQAKEKF